MLEPKNIELESISHKTSSFVGLSVTVSVKNYFFNVTL
jgi:hypothetical protein